MRQGNIAVLMESPSVKKLKGILRSTGREYYYALIGKLFQGISNFAIKEYILYIMTDFFKLGDHTESSIQLLNSSMLTCGIFRGFFVGSVAHKFKLLKYLVGFSTIFMAFGAALMFVMQKTTGINVYASPSLNHRNLVRDKTLELRKDLRTTVDPCFFC